MKRLTLDLETILATISALAIVVSLIFVGAQLQENARATRSAIAAETTATIAEWYTSLASDREVSDLFLHFFRDPHSLSVEQQYQALMHFHALMLIFQNSFYLEGEGTLDTQIRISLTEVLHAVGSAPGLKFYWEQRGPIFVNEDFIAFVEQAMLMPASNSQGLYQIPDAEALAE